MQKVQQHPPMMCCHACTLALSYWVLPQPTPLLNKLHFTKTSEAPDQGESPQGQINKENIHLGKCPYIDTESHSADEVEQQTTLMRLLSDFAPSPATVENPGKIQFP